MSKTVALPKKYKRMISLMKGSANTKAAFKNLMVETIKDEKFSAENHRKDKANEKKDGKRS